MPVQKARKFKGIDKENTRLKKLVAELSLGNETLREFTRGTVEAGLYSRESRTTQPRRKLLSLSPLLCWMHSW